MIRQINTYKLITDYHFYEKVYGLSPTTTKHLQENYNEIINAENPKIMVAKILEDIRKYPHVPQFKNQLQITYEKCGNAKKAIEMHDYILAEHPDYIFARINKALFHYHNKDYDKMLPLLGADLDIQKLYPNRNEFHIEEVVSYFSVVVVYLNAVRTDWADIQILLDLMEDISPNHPAIARSQDLMMELNLEIAKKRYDENESTRKQPKSFMRINADSTSIKPMISVQLNTLYCDGPLLIDDFYNDIAKIPTDEVIHDLKKIIKDSISRYEYLINTDDLDTNFIIHTSVLLGDIKHRDTLPMLLDILSQGEEYLDFYLGDFLTEQFWQVIYKASNCDYKKLFNFLYLPNIFTFAKTEVNTAIMQVALHQPIYCHQIKAEYNKLLDYILVNENDETFTDSVFNTCVVESIIKLNFTELFEKTKLLFDRNLTDNFFAGTFEEIESAERIEMYQDNKQKILTTFELNEWVRDLLDDSETDDNFSNDFKIESPKTINVENKIGRNEPCTCNSGKKYKHCCGK